MFLWSLTPSHNVNFIEIASNYLQSVNWPGVSYQVVREGWGWVNIVHHPPSSFLFHKIEDSTCTF